LEIRNFNVIDSFDDKIEIGVISFGIRLESIMIEVDDNLIKFPCIVWKKVFSTGGFTKGKYVHLIGMHGRLEAIAKFIIPEIFRQNKELQFRMNEHEMGGKPILKD
jgi:hypothetical protein